MLGNYEECKICNGQGFLKEIEDTIDCEVCDGNGDILTPANEEQIVFVNVYSITRHYGGPEEGGWYYNWNECIESIPVQNKFSDLMKEEAIKRYESRKHGNIYSVLGGTDIDVRIEENPKESETKERPHYE